MNERTKCITTIKFQNVMSTIFHHFIQQILYFEWVCVCEPICSMRASKFIIQTFFHMWNFCPWGKSFANDEATTLAAGSFISICGMRELLLKYIGKRGFNLNCFQPKITMIFKSFARVFVCFAHQCSPFHISYVCLFSFCMLIPLPFCTNARC